jgi:3-oxoacid CoA-transferase subunit B
MVKGMGGAMDLVASAENIIVAMMPVNKAGESKILKKCTLPLTGLGCVTKVVIELAVLKVTPQGFALFQRTPSRTAEQIITFTEADLIIAKKILEIVIDYAFVKK